jgi:hypothetical protein
MIWFFEREAARLLYEIRRHADSDAYELVVTLPDRTEVIERFDDSDVLAERVRRLQDSLRHEGWEPPPTVRGGGARFPFGPG